MLLFDAAGLALFAISGAHKALAYGVNPIMAILLGMLMGIGGGMARDILLAKIPTMLRADLYAVAALACAAIVVIANALQLPAGTGRLPEGRSASDCAFLRFGAVVSFRSLGGRIADVPGTPIRNRRKMERRHLV